MIITITGEQEFIKTEETTVSDANRVYISWVKYSISPESKYVEHKQLTDQNLPHDEDTNPYISIGKIYITKQHPVIIRKRPTDTLNANTGSDVISATPIFDR
tara:strand:- start:434 stop:739 length:306 start_codon:yes stop_codon:yes gene_type:complete